MFDFNSSSMYLLENFILVKFGVVHGRLFDENEECLTSAVSPAQTIALYRNSGFFVRFHLFWDFALVGRSSSRWFWVRTRPPYWKSFHRTRLPPWRGHIAAHSAICLTPISGSALDLAECPSFLDVMTVILAILLTIRWAVFLELFHSMFLFLFLPILRILVVLPECSRPGFGRASKFFPFSYCLRTPWAVLHGTFRCSTVASGRSTSSMRWAIAWFGVGRISWSRSHERRSNVGAQL